MSKGVQPTPFCFTTSVLSVNTASLNRSRTFFLFPFFFWPRKGQNHRVCLNFVEEAVLDLAYVIRGGGSSETWLSGWMGEGLGNGTIQPTRQLRAEHRVGTEVTPAALGPLTIPSCHAAQSPSLAPSSHEMHTLVLLEPQR